MSVTQTTVHRLNLDAQSADVPSPSLWNKLNFNRCLWDRSYGFGYHDNFLDLPLTPTLTTEIAYGKYKAYAAAGCTIVGLTAVNSVQTNGGGIQFTTDTDNDEFAFGEAYNRFRLSGDASTSGPLIFEACYAQSSIATNMAAIFFGLAETDAIAFAANTPFNSGDAITNDFSAIGFRIEEDGLGVVDTVYSDRATSFTNVGDTEGGTLAAHTFDTFGMVYDPHRSTDCVRFYKNGIKLASVMSKSTLTGLTNLDANNVGPMIAGAADSAATAFVASLKWWRIAQLVPGSRLDN